MLSIVFLRSKRGPQMGIFLSAVLGELTTRSLNFIINKCSKPPALAVEDCLQMVLLRAQVIIDDAMGWLITNQAMIQQRDMLRDAMHRGYYTLDTFWYQPHNKENAKDKIVSRSWSLSTVSSAKVLYFSSRSEQILDQLREALDRLSSMIVGVDELVVFLMRCPRLYRQPYSMHTLLGNCMFGRQMEAECVINFLLHTQPHSSHELEVLPIVGPGKISKSTLVAHVCEDERVRDHFSEIFLLHDPGFTDDEVATFTEGCAMKHQNHVSNSNRWESANWH